MSPQRHETPARRRNTAVGEWLLPDAREPMRLHEWATPIAQLRGPQPIRYQFTDRSGQQQLTTTPAEPAGPDLAITPRSHGPALARGEPAPEHTTSWSITHVPSGYALIKDIKTLPWTREAAHRLARCDVPWHLSAEQLLARFGQREPAHVRVLRDQCHTRADALAELAEQADPALNRRLQATLIELGASAYTGPAPTRPSADMPGPMQVPERTLHGVAERLEELPRTSSGALLDPSRAGATDEQRRILTRRPELLEQISQPNTGLGGDAQRWAPTSPTAAAAPLPGRSGPDPWRPPAAEPAITEPEPSASAGDDRGAQVAVAGPFSPALEGLANVELAEAAIEAFETYRAAGYDEGSARREAAIAASPPADEHDVTNMRYAGVTVTDAAVERYLEYREAGADRDEACEEAAADTAAEHTRTIGPDQPGDQARWQTPAQPEPVTPAATPPPDQAPAVPETEPSTEREAPAETEATAATEAPEAGTGAEVGRDPWRSEPAQPATTRPAPERMAPPTGGQAHEHAPADDQHRGRTGDEYEHAQPDPEPAVEHPAPDQPDGYSVTPVPAPRPAAEPAEAGQQQEAARLDAAMRRAETALQRADTELAAHQPEPARTEHAADTPPAQRVPDAEMGEVSL